MLQKKKRRGFSPRTAFAVGTVREFERILAKPAVYIDCDGGLCFENSKAMLEYTDTVICMDMGAITLRVEGDALRMTFYRRDRVAVRGRVTSLEFLYGDVRP